MKKWTKNFKNFQILVPGSISNLGCGFDALGLAISLYFKTSVCSSPRFHYEMKSNNRTIELPLEENLFLRVLRECYPVSPDDWTFTISIDTEVPIKRGLGSSACAVISALMVAARLLNLKHDNSQMIHTSLQWECHPDNLCASVLGGFTVAMQDHSGRLHHKKVPFPRSLRILLLIPEWEIATEKAREALPKSYDFRPVVENHQRLAYFMASLQTETFSALRESVKDQIHQPYRAKLMPFARDLLDRANLSSESAIVMSGSGSTFAVFYRVHEKQIRSEIQEIMAVHQVPYDLRNVIVDDEGTRIETLED